MQLKWIESFQANEVRNHIILFWKYLSVYFQSLKLQKQNKSVIKNKINLKSDVQKRKIHMHNQLIFKRYPAFRYHTLHHLCMIKSHLTLFQKLFHEFEVLKLSMISSTL